MPFVTPKVLEYKPRVADRSKSVINCGDMAKRKNRSREFIDNSDDSDDTGVGL